MWLGPPPCPGSVVSLSLRSAKPPTQPRSQQHRCHLEPAQDKSTFIPPMPSRFRTQRARIPPLASLVVHMGSAQETLMPESRSTKAEIPPLTSLCAQPGHPDAFHLVDRTDSTPCHPVRFGKTGPVSPKRSRRLGRSPLGETLSGEICRSRVNESCKSKSSPDTVGFHHGRSRAVAHGAHWLVCRCLELGLPRSGKLTPSIHDSPVGIQDNCRRAWRGVDGFGDQPNHRDFSGA